MAYPKITVNTGLALEILASDTILIPSPDLTTITGTSTGVTSGTANSNVQDELVDTTTNFLLATAPLPVVVGDRVISIVSGAATAALATITGTTIPLGADIFPNGNETYAIVKVNHLTVSGETFITKGVSVGDVVYNTTAKTVTTVTAVNSETDLTLATGLFDGSATFNDDYKIFLAGSPLGQRVINSSEGCLLYVGSNAAVGTLDIDTAYVNIKVKTTAGNDVVFSRFPVGEYLPIQVLQLYVTGSDASAISNCIAIW